MGNFCIGLNALEIVQEAESKAGAYPECRGRYLHTTHLRVYDVDQHVKSHVRYDARTHIFFTLAVIF